MNSEHGWFLIKVQRGREPADVDFFSIMVDGSLDNDILQQQVHNVTRQREELQQMEVELRAQSIARSRILEIQSSCDAKIKTHANAASELEVWIQNVTMIVINYNMIFGL